MQRGTRTTDKGILLVNYKVSYPMLTTIYVTKGGGVSTYVLPEVVVILEPFKTYADHEERMENKEYVL